MFTSAFMQGLLLTLRRSALFGKDMKFISGIGSRLRNLKIKFKLYASFITVIILTIIITSLALGAMQKSIDSSLDALHLIEDRMSIYTEISQNFEALDSAILKSVANSRINRNWYNENQKRISEFKQSLSALDPSVAEEVAALIEYSNEYIRLYTEKLEPVIKQGNSEMAFSIYFVDIFNYQATVLALLSGINNQLLSVITEDARVSTDVLPMIVTTVFAVISVVISIIVAASISTYINRSIKSLVMTVREIAQNNLDVDIPPAAQDEFGILSNSVRQMRDDLNESIGLVLKTSRNLKGELDNLQSVSHQIASSAQNAEGQAITVAAASNELVATTSDIASNCESAAHLADDTRDLTGDSMSSVRASVEAIQRQSGKTQQDGEKIRALAEQTQKIGKIVATIEEIANQTNLLALNAAIEAARAGEAGRGFAVVADEVRALASRTSSSTQEISNMVAQIQSSALAASESINDSVNNFSQVADDASQIETRLNQILGKVSDVNNQVTHIATASTQQTTATTEISENMQRITSASQEITGVAKDAIEKINSSVITINDLMVNLNRFRLRPPPGQLQSA